jgi:FAD/FMN-containing dehydrogenase
MYALFFSLLSWQYLTASPCENENIFKQTYPNQNACQLIHKIPKELRNLSYALYPNQPEYNTARFNFNKLANIFPHAIIAPRTFAEVRSVLKILKKYNLEFSIRSGGHGYEPNSLCSGYVIDMVNFKEIRLDTEKEEVYVGSGCVLGEIVQKLGALDYVVPVGDCSEVGIVGLALGGGQGLFNTWLGLTCDQVLQIKIMNAEGKIFDVSQTSYPDLFWALRGAGHGSFGIVLGMTLKMTPLKQISCFEMSWEWEPTLAKKILEAWQNWIISSPPNITTHAYVLYENGKSKITIEGTGPGTFHQEWRAYFEPLQPKVKTYTGNVLSSAPYWIKQHFNPFSKTKSSYVFQPIPAEGIDLIVDHITQLNLDQAPYTVHFTFSQFGGKIKEGNSAFFARDALIMWQQMVTWDHPEKTDVAYEMIREFHQKMMPYVSENGYTNIVDYDLGDKYLEYYYKQHVDKLIEIKRKYDPTNLFRWKQSIPISSEPTGNTKHGITP